MYFNHIFLFL